MKPTKKMLYWNPTKQYFKPYNSTILEKLEGKVPSNAKRHCNTTILSDLKSHQHLLLRALLKTSHWTHNKMSSSISIYSIVVFHCNSLKLYTHLISLQVFPNFSPFIKNLFLIALLNIPMHSSISI